MRDLSFKEARDDPQGPFRKFVGDCVELWNRALEVYEGRGKSVRPGGRGRQCDAMARAGWTQQKRIAEAEELVRDSFS